MNARLLGSLFRLRRLAAEFNHFWAYAVSPETIAELLGNSASFAEFQEKLRKLCANLNIAPIGGRYLEDASFEEGWLTAHFGRDNQLRVSINPDLTLIRTEYVNGERHTSAVYDDTNETLNWESPPQTARDAIRVLRAIAVLAELDQKTFIKAYLPSELDNDEAKLYMRVPSWAHLWVSPAVLEDLLSTR